MKSVSILIIASVLATLSPFLLGIEASLFENYLAFSFMNLVKGRVWTVITALFLHGGFIHLVGNMLFLYVFGGTVEKAVGSGRMLAAFFVGGVTAFLLSIPLYPADTLMVGASAAIFTLMAAAMLTRPLKFSWLMLSPVGVVAVAYLVYNVLAIRMGIESNVAFLSHIIGFLVGLPFGVAWSPRWMRNLAISILLLPIYFLLLAFLSRIISHYLLIPLLLVGV